MNRTSPNDRWYSREHLWLQDLPSGYRVGITVFAHEALGDVIYVELSELGQVVTTGDALGLLESNKAVADLVAPLDCRITATNSALTQSPELINEDPYGAGWLCELEPAPSANTAVLLTAVQYDALTIETE